MDYLAKATEDDAKREVDAINCYLYGDGRRAMVPSFHVSLAMAIRLIGYIFLCVLVHAPTYAESILSC
jgi:hypothetical protein